MSAAAALRLAAAGMAVFPARNEPGSRLHKSPCAGILWRARSSAQRVTVEALWRLHPGGMPAVDCGKSGLLVIDLDKKSGKPDGVAAWAALAAGREPSCPVVETPSGGRHLYFRQPARALGCVTGGLPKGIDVRGAGGYVVGVDGTSYRLISGDLGAIPEAPEWLIEVIRSGDGARKGAQASGKPSWTSTPGGSDRIRSALEHVPAWDHEDWLRVGMALRSELGDAGFPVWRDWSLAAPDKWHERLSRRRWDTFNGAGGITIKTLFWMARQHGWRDKWWHEDAARDRWAATLAAGLLRGRETELEELQRLCPHWQTITGGRGELLAHIARRQLESVADLRWGWRLPDTPGGSAALKGLLVLTIRAWMLRRDGRVAEGWAASRADDELRTRLGSALAELAARAPRLKRLEIKKLAGDASRCKDDACHFGEDVELLQVEREACAAWQLWAVDGVVVPRSEARKQRRRRAGMKAREEYIESHRGSARQVKPWVALGISRKTYYQRRKLHREAG